MLNHNVKREHDQILIQHDFVMWSTSCQSELLEDGLRELVCEVDIPDTVPLSWKFLEYGGRLSHVGHERHSKIGNHPFFLFWGTLVFEKHPLCHCLYIFKLSQFVLKA